MFQKLLINSITSTSALILLLYNGESLTNSADILQVDASYPTPWWVIKIKKRIEYRTDVS